LFVDLSTEPSLEHDTRTLTVMISGFSARFDDFRATSALQHAETTARLTRLEHSAKVVENDAQEIKFQVIKTNGRVTEHDGLFVKVEAQIAKLFKHIRSAPAVAIEKIPLTFGLATKWIAGVIGIIYGTYWVLTSVLGMGFPPR